MMEQFSFHHQKMDVFVAGELITHKLKFEIGQRRREFQRVNRGLQGGKPLLILAIFHRVVLLRLKLTSHSQVRMLQDRLFQKKNAGLLKLLADKNKLIELSGAEVQKMRATLQIVKQQNLQLAQSNGQIQAELNLVREMQKSLKHELGCKTALIIAKNLELEGKANTTCVEQMKMLLVM